MFQVCLCALCALTVERQPIGVTTSHQRLGENDRSKMTVLARARSQYLRDRGQAVAFVKESEIEGFGKHGSTLLMLIKAESLHQSQMERFALLE